MSDPFFRLRAYFTADHHKHKDAVITIALAIKALNAAHTGQKIQALSWKSQGDRIEDFPVLSIGRTRTATE